MIVRGMREDHLQECARVLGLELYNLRPQNKRGTAWAFRLVPKNSRAHYARRSASGRRIKATCYHGFRDFYYLLWEQEIDSVTTTMPASGRITFRSRQSFTDKLAAFAYADVGNYFNPARFIDLCECDGDGPPSSGPADTDNAHGARSAETQFSRGEIIDGKLQTTHVRTLHQSAMLACPFAIMVPEHYRDDESCKCDDADERARMIAEWEYSETDFAAIPLRKG